MASPKFKMAERFQYKAGSEDRVKAYVRDKTRRENPEKLYYDDSKDQRTTLSFFTEYIPEWLEEIKIEFPELKEKNQDLGKILQKDGKRVIQLYNRGTVVVYGDMMETFEKPFLQMKERVGGHKNNAIKEDKEDELDGQEMTEMLLTIQAVIIAGIEEIKEETQFQLPTLKDNLQKAMKEEIKEEIQSQLLTLKDDLQKAMKEEMKRMLTDNINKQTKEGTLAEARSQKPKEEEGGKN